ncbi:MAG: SpoIIE family protein phosphatase [Gammaproteobacteria bacterium]
MAVLKKRSAEWASAFVTLPGEAQCGDRHFVADVPEGTLIAVVDGIGHGDEAAFAAERAIEVIERYGAAEPIDLLMERCDRALRDTRGAAISIAHFAAEERTLNWLAIGNVAGRVQRRAPVTQFPNESLLMRPGVVGRRPLRAQPSAVRIGRGDLLIFATDGVDPDFVDSIAVEDHVEAIAETLLATHGKTNDDALVFVIRLLT